MDLYKIGVKIFVTNPQTVNLRDFIPVFQGWIQQQKIEGHRLLEVPRHDAKDRPAPTAHARRQ